MSQSKQPAADPAEGTAASRMRRRTRMRARNENEEEKQPAQSSTHVSPAMRLYRHALESIFAMLNFKDLIPILAVSRSWSAAVRSMKPIGARIHCEYWSTIEDQVRPPPPPPGRLAASPLIRHVATIEFASFRRRPPSSMLTKQSIALLAQHVPNLTSLDCSTSHSPRAPWILPAGLTSLYLWLDYSFSAADLNALFRCASTLPVLKRLCLLLPDSDSAPGVDFSLLAASPSLTDFTFRHDCGDHPALSDDQVTQIRTSLGHLRRISVACMNADSLARFLQPPVTAHWQDIGPVWLEAAAEALLVKLPSLTALLLYFEEDRPHADFLSQMPQLKDLILWTKRREADNEEDEDEEGSFHVPSAALLHSLSPCTGITELYLHCGFSSAQLTALFASLTSLTKLTIDADLVSLECFSSGPITQTLEELTMRELKLPPFQLAHLYGLRLRSLEIIRCFNPRLGPATIDRLSPPTQLLPMLTRFVCKWKIEDEDEWDCAERNGPSFHLMQKRLTQ